VCTFGIRALWANALLVNVSGIGTPLSPLDEDELLDEDDALEELELDVLDELAPDELDDDADPPLEDGPASPLDDALDALLALDDAEGDEHAASQTTGAARAQIHDEPFIPRRLPMPRAVGYGKAVAQKKPRVEAHTGREPGGSKLNTKRSRTL